MTKMEYAKLVCRLYEVANNSDQPLRAEPWINPEACSLHCRAYDKILRDLFPDQSEYDDALATIGTLGY